MGTLFEPMIHSRLKVGLTLIITLMVISSPIFMLVNPALAATPSSSTDGSPSSPSTIGQDGSDFTTQAALSSLSARPTNNIVNTNSFYDVVFLTATAGTIKTIQVTFPAGTTIPSGAFFNEAEGIGPGTASKSGQTITYTVTNALNVPAGTKIRLEFANINNPISPSASYAVTVTTRNAANAIIDGPTQSTAYTMKQIGVNAIANNAITTPKIEDNAVTNEKIEDNAVTFSKISPDAIPTITPFIVWKDSTPGNDEVLFKRGVEFDLETKNLSTNTETSSTPAIASDGNIVIVVWVDDISGNKEVVYKRSIDGGASFGPTVNLSNNVGESTRPEVTMVGNSVYVVWEDNTDGNDEILYRRSINAGSSFESAINLSHSPDASTNPDIAASGNNVYVVWDGILFTRSTNGGVSFSDPVDITISGGIIPAIAASGDHVYVTWRGSFFKRSIDGGASFGPTVPMGINCQSSPDKCPVIAASGENVYLLLVQSNGGSGCTPALCGADVLYRRSIDGGASFGGFILTSGFSYSPAVSATGNSVYVVWTDSIQPLDSGGIPDIEYRKSTDGGASFGPTENLSNNAGSSMEPAISAASSSSLQ